MFYIPMRIMRGEKNQDDTVRTQEDWPWTHSKYEFQTKFKPSEIESVVIDPSGRMADVNPGDNEMLFKGK